MRLLQRLALASLLGPIALAAAADARFLLVDGVDHDRKALQPHATRFLAAVLGRAPAATARR